MNFKIVFPSGYIVEDIINDNLDVNIVFSNGKVYFATLFTVDNVKKLLNKYNYFWSCDLLVVQNLKKITIKNSLKKFIEDGYLDSAFTEIGNIKEVYHDNLNYNDIIDLASDIIELPTDI